jgi:hypothetical protein
VSTDLRTAVLSKAGAKDGNSPLATKAVAKLSSTRVSQL